MSAFSPSSSSAIGDHTMLLSASSLISSSLDVVADQLKLPLIPDLVKQSSLKVCNKRGADLLIMLTHPDWSEWRVHVSAVAGALYVILRHVRVDNNTGRDLHISCCEPASRPSDSIAISFNRSRTVPQILKQHEEMSLSSAIPPLAAANDKKFTVISVKTPDRTWICRRIDMFTDTIRHALSMSPPHKPALREIVTPIDHQENDDTAAEFDAITRQLDPCAGSPVGCVQVDCSPLDDAELESCSFSLRPQSNVIPAILRLRPILLTSANHHVILIVHYSLVTAYRRAIAVLSLTTSHTSLSQRFTIIPVEQVNCDQDPDEFVDWLKIMIATQSVSDDDGPGDSPSMDTDTVLTLFQTCIKFVLLARPAEDRLTVDHSPIKGYLSVQYSVSRLNSLIHKFESAHPDQEAALVDYSLLTTDLEWDLMFRHVQQFDDLMRAESDAVMAPHKVISFVMSLIRDLSKNVSPLSFSAHPFNLSLSSQKSTTPRHASW